MRSLLLPLCLAPLSALAAPLDCTVEPRAFVDIVSAERGIVERVMVTRGDRVALGQDLVALDDQLQQLQRTFAQARAGSDVQLRAAEAQLSQAQTALDRAQRLVQRNAAAGVQVEEAEIAVALNELAVEQARLEMSLAQMEVTQAQALLDRRRIRSPAAGIVTSVAVSPGEVADDQDPLLTIAIIDPLHVEVFVPAALFQKIAPGDVYDVQQTLPIAGTWAAEVLVVDRVLDPASQTFGVRLGLANPDGTIPAGTRCLIDFQPG